ncbi:hypothetical protein L7F22_011514 [Adiantum nelumboides]|nr:hypothetical protein [Adiantum nelumboides]
MSNPVEVSVENILGGMDMDTLMAFADNDFEGIFEKLQEPFDDLEQRIVISSMVQEAVSKGFLKAIEEDSLAQLAGKDMEIASLRDLLKEKDVCICDLQKILGIAEDETFVAGSAERTRSKHLWDFLQESQRKWRESETDVAAKEKELERLASSMASMALIIDHESKRAAMLEKQLKDVKEQDAIKSGQISSFQQDIDKLKLDNSSQKRQARLKRLQFDDTMEHIQTDLQQQSVSLESLLQEKRALEKTLEEGNRAFSKLQLEPDDVTEEVSSSQGKQTHEAGDAEPKVFGLQPPLPSQQVGSQEQMQAQVMHTANSIETPVRLSESMQTPKPMHMVQEQVLLCSRRVIQTFDMNITVLSFWLEGVNEKCQFLRNQLTKYPMTEVHYRQRLTREMQNLQKAEAEVDLLGDEVDSLMDILEEVHVTFDMYAPVLVHYPKMREIAKTVKQEIQLRIDPKYGA